MPRGSRSIQKAASKDIVSVDIKSMTNEELKEELAALGSPVGPIMPSTRGLYERKLGIHKIHSQTVNLGIVSQIITKYGTGN